MDFTIYWEVFSQLASRCRVIQRRLADGPVFTFTHLRYRLFFNKCLNSSPQLQHTRAIDP